MNAVVMPREGKEWQTWADELLIEHYGPTSYVKFPDTLGDGGIEGFTRPCGHAYQAYGADRTKTGQALFEAQRDKMTRDINKFIQNRPLFTKLFGEVKICRWVLFVPAVGLKELKAHAHKMTQKVRDADLPYVTEDFYVTYCDEDSFAKERDKIAAFKRDCIRIQTPIPNADRVAEWKSGKDALMQTLGEKLDHLESDSNSGRRSQRQRQMLSWYLQGRELLAKLNEVSPTTYERVFEAKTQYEQVLLAHELTATDAKQQLKDVMAGFRAALDQAAGSLSQPNTMSLVCEAVSDWMMRCPLDFQESQSSV